MFLTEYIEEKGVYIITYIQGDFVISACCLKGLFKETKNRLLKEYDKQNFNFK